MTAKPGRHVTAYALVSIVAGLLSAMGAENVAKLSDAVRDGDAAQVKDLLARKVDVNARGSDGSTALLIAADRGKPELMAMLVKAGANPSIADENGDSPLSVAVAHGKPELVKMLLD